MTRSFNKMYNIIIRLGIKIRPLKEPLLFKFSCASLVMKLSYRTHWDVGKYLDWKIKVRLKLTILMMEWRKKSNINLLTKYRVLLRRHLVRKISSRMLWLIDKKYLLKLLQKNKDYHKFSGPNCITFSYADTCSENILPSFEFQQ